MYSGFVESHLGFPVVSAIRIDDATKLRMCECLGPISRLRVEMWLFCPVRGYSSGISLAGLSLIN